MASGDIVLESGVPSGDMVVLIIDGPDKERYATFVVCLLEKSKHNLTDSMMDDAENNLFSMKDRNQLEIAKVEQDVQLAKSEFVRKKENQTVALVLQKNFLIEEHFKSLEEDMHVLEKGIILLQQKDSVELEDKIQDMTDDIEANKQISI